MKQVIPIILGLCFTFMANAQKKDLTHFYFTETFLEGFTKQAPTAEQLKDCDLIYQSNDKIAQIRYSFRPDMKDVAPASVETYATALFLNQSASLNPNNLKMMQHNPESVKGDYAGTSGYFALFETNKNFSAEYPVCLAFYIYKEKVGAFVIYLMAKSQEDIGKSNYAQALGGNMIKFK